MGRHFGGCAVGLTLEDFLLPYLVSFADLFQLNKCFFFYLPGLADLAEYTGKGFLIL